MVWKDVTNQCADSHEHSDIGWDCGDRLAINKTYFLAKKFAEEENIQKVAIILNVMETEDRPSCRNRFDNLRLHALLQYRVICNEEVT